MNEAAWWQTAVIYQVFLRSFQDSNGDGEGDLQGLISRLGYLRNLGADAIWLSPIFASPWADCGYDVSDYEQIHPKFGSLETFDELVRTAQTHRIRIILDWVPNHTSDQHPWFIASRRDRVNDRRNWYLWHDPAPDGGPPNNWLSVFGGSAWTLDETTGQYYLHAFLPQQPDLNWRDPAVREAMCQTLRFWARRGVAGFRIDAADMLLKDRLLRSNPPNPDKKPGDAPDNAVIQKYTRNRRGNHRLMSILRRTADELGVCLLGEMYQPSERLVKYYGTPERPELHLPLNLQLLHPKWDADNIHRTLDDYYQALPSYAWPSWSLGNHDIRRLASRAPGKQARLAAVLLLTLRGTPTLYYGDELGMTDTSVPTEQSQDPQTKSWPGHSRDVARTPMQWEATSNAGFTTGVPWLPLGAAEQCNMAAQNHDPKSLLSLYRRLIALRRTESLLTQGDYRSVDCCAPLVSYERSFQGRRLLVALNLGSKSLSLPVRGPGTLLLSTHLDRENEAVGTRLELRGEEGGLVLFS